MSKAKSPQEPVKRIEEATKVAIVGDRNWTNRRVMASTMKLIRKTATVVTSGARGAETMAEAIAAQLELHQVIHRANWGRYGRAAAHRRDKLIFATNPDLLLIFRGSAQSSYRIKQMMKQAGRLGITTKLIENKGRRDGSTMGTSR